MPIQPCQHLRIGVWPGRFGKNISVNEIAHGSQFQGPWTIAETRGEEARRRTIPQDVHNLPAGLELREILRGDNYSHRPSMAGDGLSSGAGGIINKLAETAFRLLQLPGGFHGIYHGYSFRPV